MEIKILEIRDAGTFIPAMGIRLGGRTPVEEKLLWRVGFGPGSDGIVVMRLTDQEAHADPYDWNPRGRTMPTAHDYIRNHWSELASGDVVDVEFILGERLVPKVSEVRQEAESVLET